MRTAAAAECFTKVDAQLTAWARSVLLVVVKAPSPVCQHAAYFSKKWTTTDPRAVYLGPKETLKVEFLSKTRNPDDWMVCRQE